MHGQDRHWVSIHSQLFRHELSAGSRRLLSKVSVFVRKMHSFSVDLSQSSVSTAFLHLRIAVSIGNIPGLGGLPAKPTSSGANGCESIFPRGADATQPGDSHTTRPYPPPPGAQAIRHRGTSGGDGPPPWLSALLLRPTPPEPQTARQPRPRPLHCAGPASFRIPAPGWWPG